MITKLQVGWLRGQPCKVQKTNGTLKTLLKTGSTSAKPSKPTALALVPGAGTEPLKAVQCHS